MKIINAKNKNDLMAQIGAIKPDDTEIYLSLRPTMHIVHRILDQSQSISKISCPPSLYLQVSKKVFKYAQGKNITLSSGDFKVGRPMIHDPETIKQILNKRAAGVPAKALSQEFEVPLRTVYFYLKNGLEE